MALNWQDVAQVRFQDTSQATKNLADSFANIASPLQDVIQTQTDDRQNALDNSVSRMTAQASGMNAMSSYQDTLRKMTPEYQALQKAQTEAQTITAQSNATKAATDAQMAEAKMNAYNNIGQNVTWRNVINPTTAPVNTGITPDAIPAAVAA